MKLLVVTLAGRELEVEVNSADRVLVIKERIEEKEGIPPAQQRLIFGGKHIEDVNTLESYGLGEGSKVNLVLSLKGGF